MSLKIKALLLSAALILPVVLSACSSGGEVSLANNTAKLSTGDEIYPAKSKNSVEESDNVYGCRFCTTLDEFTQRYNELCTAAQIDGQLSLDGWVSQDGEPDANGVELDYYHYNLESCSLTATVEAKSGKLMNMGCATTAEKFVSEGDGTRGSEEILLRSAVLAQAVCKFPEGSTSVLRDIFYCTAFEGVESLYYEGFVFTMSTSSSNDGDLVMFRVFPLDEALANEWSITEYGEYMQKNSE